MEGIEIIFMVAGVVFGLSGTLLAKKSREKSSYPMLITSGIFAVLTLFCLVTAAVFVFFVK
ncbi:MAG: hypothetical protein IJA17_09305 [Oscillospiraceae bacterium]|nr:hypothetical protein [Oscillospiraceae bacterium]